MRVECVIADRGFLLYVNEYDIVMDVKRLFTFGLFWKSPVPRLSLSFSCRGDEGHLRVQSSVNGKGVRWSMRAPIVRESL